MTPSNSSKIRFALVLPVILLLACSLRGTPTPPPPPTEALQPVQFSAAAPSTPTASPDLSYLLTATATATSTPTATPLPAGPPPVATETPAPPPTATPEPPPTQTPPPPSATPESPSAEAPAPAEATSDFVVRLVHMRTNAENSWDGVLSGNCGSDHSIYVHVVDAQENLLDGVLVGDKYGNFEVPTGVDGPGLVRILVWSATMELAVTGGPDGARYTSEFTPPLSTLDEAIPLDWLQAGGYCESAEDCRQRVETNQLCRGHYSYDVVFQRTW